MVPFRIIFHRGIPHPHHRTVNVVGLQKIRFLNLLLLFVKINVRLLFKLFKLKINVKLLFELFKLKYFTFYLHLVVVQYISSLVYVPNISIHCMGVNAFSFRNMSKIKFLRICYLTILNILYFCTIPAVATRNVKKLFNSDTQASINYLTVLSQFCANYYVSTKNDIMNKTHNVNGFYNNIYYCCNAYALHL